jgi:hypothetical protein
MRYKYLFLVVGVVSVLAAGLFTANGAGAVDAKNSLTVSPLIFELASNPGDTLSNDIRVDNTSDKPLDLAVDVRNFVAVGEEGQASLTDEDTTYSLAKWITASPSSFTVPAKGSQLVKFTIKSPANAEPGGHFGSVVIKTRPSTQPGQVVIAQEVSPLILLKMAGKAVENASVESFDAAPNYSETGPIDFKLRIRNSGSVHVKPQSSISIKDMFGNEVAKLQVDSKNVLPDSIRRFTSEWKPGFLLGQYTATATVVYGSDNQVIQSQTTFWGFPTKLALMIFVPLLIVLILLFVGRKRVKRAMRVLFSKDQAAERTLPSHSDKDVPDTHSTSEHRHREDL